MAAKKAYELKANVTSWMYSLPDGTQLHLHGDKSSYETSDPDVIRELDIVAGDAATGLKHAEKKGDK